MKEFTYEEIESKVPTGIPEHIDRNPVPEGDNPNEYLQAEELNLIVRFLDDHVSIIKQLMINSNDLKFNVDNYIQYFHSDEELQDILDNGIDNKLYFNSDTKVLIIGDLDGGGYNSFDLKELEDNLKKPKVTALENSHPYVVVVNDAGESAKRGVNDFGKVDTIDGIEADANKNVELHALRKVGENIITNETFNIDYSNQEYRAVLGGGQTFLLVNKNNSNQWTSFGRYKIGFDDKDKDLPNKGRYIYLDPNKMTVKWGFIPTPVEGNPSAFIENNFYILPDRVDGGRNVHAKFRAIDGYVAYLQDIQDIFAKPTNWTNASQRFSGLVDKSSDATYNALMGLDSGGNLAKLTALGNVLESGLQTVSSAQALRIGQLLNGGQGSAGALNVTSITPPVVDRLYNVDEVVVLRGTNLKLNAVSMGISILNSENNEVAIIPNNSINIYDDGLSLVFTYNFSQLGIGEYRLKIISGTKILITSVNIIVLENIESINLSNLTWDILKSPELTNNDIVVASGQSLATELRIAKDTNLPVYSLKSSEVFSQGDDFYITGNMSVTKQDWTGANTLLAQLSLVYSNIVNDTLNYRGLVSININRTSNSNRFNITTNIDSRQITFESPSGSVNSDFFLMKQGNLITIRIGNTIWQTSIINNSGYSFMYTGPAKNYTFDRYLSTSVNFTRAFKF